MNVTIHDDFENKIISKGNNFPSFDISKNKLNTLCILLHEKIKKDKIKSLLKISERDFNLKVEALKGEGLVKEKEGGLFPTFPCITKMDGDKIYGLCDVIGTLVSDLILNKLDEIIKETYKIESFKDYPFEELSFFILSGVILDFIQIDYVEEGFLQSERPIRNGRRYYFSLMQVTSNTKEPFGIYGNHCENYGEISYCMYGNERYSTKNFITVSEKEIRERYTNSKEVILKQLINAIKQETLLNSSTEKIIKELNLLNDGESIPLINKEEYGLLHNIAKIVTPELIKILNNNRLTIVEAYNQSSYFKETTFEEYFIWYYHFLYSYITDGLIKRGVISKPKDGVFKYILI